MRLCPITDVVVRVKSCKNTHPM